MTDELDFFDPFAEPEDPRITAAREEARRLIWLDNTCSCGKVAARHPSGWCQECIDDCDDRQEGWYHE